jgi:hypothetical protein
MIFNIKIFESALMGDIKQWWSRHHRCSRCYCRRYRRSRSNVERKRVEVKGKKLVMLYKR